MMPNKKGFGKATIKEYRGFLLECNFVNSRGNEANIAYEIIEIPKMKNSILEMRYLSFVIWHLLENEYKNEHINQVFCLTKDGNESLMRIQTKEADDEEMKNFQAPSEEAQNNYLKSVKNEVKRIHGTESIEYRRTRLKVRSLKEYFDPTINK